jgi:hypothetical protein
MKATSTTTDRATLLTISGDDGTQQSAVAFVPFETVAKDSPIAGAFSSISYALPVLSDQLNNACSRLMPNARADELSDIFMRNLARPFQAAQASTIAEAAAIDAAETRLKAYRAGDPSLNAMIVNRFATMPLAEQASWAQTASLEETSALQAAGRAFFRNATDDNIWQLVDSRHMTQAHIRITGLQADYKRQPTAADPIAHGPDLTAVELAAAQALERHTGRRDIVAAAEGSLRSMVAAVALATGKTPDAAYDLLIGNAA